MDFGSVFQLTEAQRDKPEMKKTGVRISHQVTSSKPIRNQFCIVNQSSKTYFCLQKDSLQPTAI